MTDIKKENRAFFWATHFLRSLYQSSVSHAVISPGSRSTPLTMAAAALPGLNKHVILDERSAAFFALGIGKATNRPAALICTSGTAVANYYPAVIEARMSGVPLLLLTADRPPNLLNAGANQAINQHNIFGKYPVFFHDIGEPTIQKSNLKNLGSLAEKSVHHSRVKQGPVHLNFPFSKPLEPEVLFVDSVRKKNIDLNPNSTADSSKEIPFQISDKILAVINEARQPLIIIGQLTPQSSPAEIFSLAKTLHAPVLSEQGITDEKYAIQGFEGFLRQKIVQNNLEPDLILRFGRQPASKSLLQAITHWNSNHHIYMADSEHASNIAHTTTDFMNWNGKPFDPNKFVKKTDDWLKQWKKTENKYFKKSDRLLTNSSELTDGHVYHHLMPLIPKDWPVFISNSFPARDQSMFGRWNTRQVFTNRGASGIDGITSTAMGVATGLQRPFVLFTGDLAFLHDTNALLNAKELEQPLVIVIINNSGGSIFRMLPIVNHGENFTTYFETPQEIDIAKLSGAYNLNYRQISQPDELPTINFADFTEPGLHLIEYKTEPDTSMQLRQKLWN